ncbi:hypothetical protein CW304_00655 [Bacillus sp. UFRGS-B20]|nr:hypothetical protein CW304_00655 [Bacillus sp. UFRGS-B20]
MQFTLHTLFIIVTHFIYFYQEKNHLKGSPSGGSLFFTLTAALLFVDLDFFSKSALPSHIYSTIRRIMDPPS